MPRRNAVDSEEEEARDNFDAAAFPSPSFARENTLTPQASSVTDYPEVEKIGDELKRSVASLERLIPSEDGSSRTVTLSHEQEGALRGLSSKVNGLIHCLNLRHQDLHVDPDNESKNQSKDELFDLAKTPDQRRLLNELVGAPSARRPARRPSRNRGHSQSMIMTSRPSLVTDSSRQSLPTELLRDLILEENGPNEEGGGGGIGRRALLDLCGEYGGVKLSPQFTKAAPPKRSMKSFAKAISTSNVFIKEVRAMSSIGKDDLDYLPREFSSLDIKERRRLAKLLSWDHLKKWEFDVFLVDELSSHTQFKKIGNIVGADDLKSSLKISPSDDAKPQDWDKNFETISRGCPMVLIGWAILASPYSQLAMAKNVKDERLIQRASRSIKQVALEVRGSLARTVSIHPSMAGLSREDLLACSEHSTDSSDDNDSNDDDDNDNEPPSSNSKNRPARQAKAQGMWNGGYFFVDDLKISPRAIAAFLRKVEGEYRGINENRYHNNIHGADVVQTTHSILQMGGNDMALQFASLEVYTLLLAAALHDIQHPGTNNNYQVNARTELARIYNDYAVLENMHASRACKLLEVSAKAGDLATSALGATSPERQKQVRTEIIRSILATDMSRHFSDVAKMTRGVEEVHTQIADEGKSRNFLAAIGGEKFKKCREKFLPFILHMADISNPTKKTDVTNKWVECCYAEFFCQGDQEAKEGLPVSPLCNRQTTSIPESQLGFMRFVVKGGFDLLAKCIPEVNDTVLRQYAKNLEYWEGKKAELEGEK